MSSHTATSARKSQPPEASRHHIREEADLTSEGQSLSAPSLAAPSAQGHTYDPPLAIARASSTLCARSALAAGLTATACGRVPHVSLPPLGWALHLDPRQIGCRSKLVISSAELHFHR